MTPLARRRSLPGAIALLVAAFLVAAPATALAGGGTVFQYHDGPKAIPDGHGKAVFKFPDVPLIGSAMTVPALDLDVRINHRRTQDLTLILRSPLGDKVTLSKHNTPEKTLGKGPACPDEPLPIIPPVP